MEGCRRYAVYFAPARGSALGRFGDAWLGWDAENGTVPPPPAVPGLPLPRETLVARPRRYGFHATLKAPFRLAPGRSVGALGSAVAALAAGMTPFALALRLAPVGAFLALVPQGESAAIDGVAAACVTGLDDFRAPMTAAERARRAEGLGARERDLLDRWGYPFVLDAFGFHLTLTGPLDDAPRDAAAAALAPVLAPLLAVTEPIGELCLFGEPEAGPFRLLRRYPFGGR